MPEQALKLAEQGKAQLPASVVERINSRLRWAQAVYSEDFTYAKGAYKVQTKTLRLPAPDDSNPHSRVPEDSHKSNRKNLIVFAQVTGLFVALAIWKNR